MKMSNNYSLQSFDVVKWTIQTVTKYYGELSDLQIQGITNLVTAFPKTPAFTHGKALKFLIPHFDPDKVEKVTHTVITCAAAFSVQMEGEKTKEQWADVKVIKVWYTNNDDLVCPTCRRLNEKEVRIYKEFVKGIFIPPAHLGCRCWMSSTTDL